jgi:hypothetical protein
MLITTSRRPSHLARILCRELVLVLPRSRYVPRGAKTVEDVASVAREFGHDRAMIIDSVSGKPKEIRFLEVGQNWRWADAVVELGDVKLHRGAGRRNKIEDARMHADGSMALEFAEWCGKFLGIGRFDELPRSGGVVLVTSDGGLNVQFKVMPGSETIGPVLKITAFGSLFGGEVK